MKRYLSLLGTAVLSCLLVLFVAVYGVDEKWPRVLGHAWLLMKDTAAGVNLKANYFGVNGIEFWYSIRLIIFAVFLSLLIGVLLALIRVRAKSWVKTIVEVPFTLLESVPEPIYIVLMVLVVLFLLEHTTIQIPAFPAGSPSWLDTLIPAIALGLPGSFYLSRVLQMSVQDELNAQYVTTALSKGVSKSRSFYRHVLSNVIPGFIKQIAVVTAIVLSSTLFAEYMLGYQGAIFHFVEYGFLGTQRPRDVPAYEPGLIVMVGSFLVGMWLVFALASRIWYDIKFPEDIETTPRPQLTKYQRSWMITGAVLILAVVVCSIDPHLVTQNGPSQEHLFSWKTFKSAPYPPSAKYPTGTDFLGRDLLSRALSGTKDTLVPAVGASIMVVIFSLGISSLATINPNGWIAKAAKVIGNTLSGLPVLVILMVVMHQRNLSSPYQAVVYFAWLVLFETGRGVYSFTKVYEQWYQYGFVEGALSVGRSRISILFVHFRKWLQRFAMEFAFLELSRILSLMTMLAVFQVYAVEKMGFAEFYDSRSPIIISAHTTWVSMIGDAVLNGVFMNQAWFLYAPVLCLLLVAVGSNLIARGLRGKSA